MSRPTQAHDLYQISTSAPSLVGELLSDRYQVIKHLSRGGFGETYVAKDLHRPGQPQCVVKCLKPFSGSSSRDTRRLFHQEAEILERLGNHDQIPRLLAHFEKDNEFYLVQELIEGRSLSEELKQGARCSESQVIALLQEVLNILQFVHAAGVIHRDIKPDNLIRRQSDQRLVLIDFGAVKAIERSLPDHLIPVTVAIRSEGYTPAEQLRGHPRPNSDIYALGMVGIQALTGMHPKQFEESLHLSEMKWNQQIEVNPHLMAVLATMTRYHWKARYSAVTDVLHDLQELMDSLPAAPATLATPSEQSTYTPTEIVAAPVPPQYSLSEIIPPSLLSQPPLADSQQVTRSGRKSSAMSEPATNQPQVTQPKTLQQRLKLQHWKDQVQPLLTPKLLPRLTGIGLISLGILLFLGFVVGLVPTSSRPPDVENSIPRVKGLLTTLEAQSPVQSLEFYAQGTMLVSGDADRNVKIWDLNSPQPIQTFSNHFNAIAAVAASPTALVLASGGTDQNINLWNAQTGELINSLNDHAWAITALAFSPDGQTLISSSEDKTIKAWNVQDGELIHTISDFGETFLSLAVSPDGWFLAGGSADHTIKLWNLDNFELIRTFRGHTSDVNAVEISPNSAVLVSGDVDGTLKIWNLYTGQLIRDLTGHTDQVYSIAISADGRTLASGSADKTVRLWNLDSGQLLRTFRDHSSEVRSVAVSTDGKTLASGSLDGTIKLWQITE